MRQGDHHEALRAKPALPNLKVLRGSKTLDRLSAETGISVSQLSRYQQGARDPTLAHLRAIAAALGVSVEQLVEDWAR